MLSVDEPQDGDIVNEPSPTISGRVARVSQIMTYVNGSYHTTVPLDTGSTTFSYATSLTPGENIIRLVGIDPCSNTSLEAIMHITFDPMAIPTNPVKEIVNQTKDTAVGTQEYLQDQVNQASATKPASFLSDLTYDVMTALDLAPHTGQQPEPYMLSRFWAITAGTALIILTNPVITLYHMARYQLLQWKVHAFPKLVRHHAAFVLRTGGVFLLVIGFFM